MEERELTRLLQQLGDRTTPSPPPLRRIVDAGEALQGRRSARVRVFAMSAAAAALIGGGAVAATVIQLPAGGGDASSSAGGAAMDDSGGDAADSDTAGEAGAAAEAAGPVTVTPSALAPGEPFSLTSEEPDAVFGLAWDLVPVDETSPERYVLAAGTDGQEPRAVAADQAGALDDVAVVPPLRFVLPPDLAPGDYLLCEVGSPDVCASLVVTR